MGINDLFDLAEYFIWNILYEIKTGVFIVA